MSMLRLCILLLPLLSGCATTSHPPFTFSTPTDANGSIVANGSDPKSSLQVRVADAPPSAPPLVGDITRKDNTLIFTPRYPFQTGLKYIATLSPQNLSAAFTLPTPSLTPETRITAIYPTSDELPENLLKFYIHFSAPMSRGEAYKRIQLLDENNKVIPWPFLELSEELWNPEMNRFTLFFEPGRIKQGLVPRMELGPALLAGKSYTLTIDSAWHDSANRPLVRPMQKKFRVTEPDHRQPDPARWRVGAPDADSTHELMIILDEPLDHAMLHRVLSVRDNSGKRIPGRILVDQEEKRWKFSPEFPWKSGKYFIVVETILEDLAGNSIGRAFEVDTNKSSPPDAPATVEIGFEISSD